jgi:hypothetical protein
MHADKMIEPPPQRIVWYYSEYQPRLNEELSHMVQFKEGCPDFQSEFNDSSKPTLIIIDDLMDQCSGELLTQLFTRGSHHRNLSVWFLMQNFFHQSRGIRTATLNAQYIILFKNPRDKQQIKVLARQVYDDEAKAMQQAYVMATEQPYGYLLIDMKTDTPEHLRLRSKILPGEALEIFTARRLFREERIELYR